MHPYAADRHTGEDDVLLGPVGDHVEPAAVATEVAGVAGERSVVAVEDEARVEQHRADDVEPPDADREHRRGHQPDRDGHPGDLIRRDAAPGEERDQPRRVRVDQVRRQELVVLLDAHPDGGRRLVDGGERGLGRGGRVG